MYAALGSTDTADLITGAYAAWQADVAALGGQEVPYPVDNLAPVWVGRHLGPIAGLGSVQLQVQGLPSARYGFDTIYPTGADLSAALGRSPDVWSADSGYGYYLAPADALEDWYRQAHPLPDPIGTAATVGKWAVIGLVALVGVEALHALPRGTR